MSSPLFGLDPGNYLDLTVQSESPLVGLDLVQGGTHGYGLMTSAPLHQPTTCALLLIVTSM